jgi:hypothetical protein
MAGLTLDGLKQELFSDLSHRLGTGIIDIETDADHFETAFRYAIKVYRQRAQNATEETYTLLTTLKNQDVYTLPEQFVNVRSLFRRTIGLDTGSGGSASFDPFSSAILNTYLLQYNQAGGMATYDLYAGYVELAARMFGGYVVYTFNPVTKQLRIVRDPKASGEHILIWADMLKSEEILLQDHGAGVWLADWTLAELKVIIGQAREKFANIAGPSGGTSLNGAAMKAEGEKMKETLLIDLKNFVDYSQPLTWVIG